jgi:hypothetical protein
VIAQRAIDVVDLVEPPDHPAEGRLAPQQLPPHDAQRLRRSRDAEVFASDHKLGRRVGAGGVQVLIGVNTVIYYSATNLHYAGISTSKSIGEALFVGITNVLFTTVDPAIRPGRAPRAAPARAVLPVRAN